MICLFRRGKVYWFAAHFEGKTVRQSLRTRDGQVARELLRQIELDILSGGKLKSRTWAEFEDEFLQAMETQVRATTVRSYRYVVERFGKFVEINGPHLLRDITPATISDFCIARRADQHPDWKRPKTEGGLRFDLRSLHRAFTYAVDCGYMPKNPVIVGNRSSKPRGTLPFSQDEISRMLQHAEHWPQLRAIVLTFLHTGLRIGDVISLSKQDVVDDALVVNTRKRDKVVTLQVHGALRAALDTHLAAQNSVQRKSALLFSTDTGKRIVSLDKILRRLWLKAGITGGHAHRFRDTVAVRLLSKGASTYDVAKILGNSADVVERYYAPYVLELQQRGARLLSMLDYSDEPATATEANSEPISELRANPNQPREVSV